ncbi:MAG: type II toxin-antitoxin system VapC family toxin [Thiolinea sp.]
MRYLVDTNILSEQTKRVPDAGVIRRWELDSIFSCTSATVWHELWYGIHLMTEGRRKQVLSASMQALRESEFTVMPFCRDAAEWLAEEAVRLQRRGITPTKYDSEIAAVAIVNHLTVVTRNVDDFKIYDGLRVENWFES